MHPRFGITNCNVKIKKRHFTNRKKRDILTLTKEIVHNFKGTREVQTMIGWGIIAVVAIYGFVNIYNSERHAH